MTSRPKELTSSLTVRNARRFVGRHIDELASAAMKSHKELHVYYQPPTKKKKRGVIAALVEAGDIVKKIY